MKLVFDFGGVLFRWEPQAFLARLLPQYTATEADAIALKEVFFQGYGGDWGDFDRGTVEPDVLAERIASRIGLHKDEVRRVIAGVPAELQPITDTVALLRRLHAQGRVLYYEPAIFEMARRSFEAEPEQILFIDDYASNIVAARAAGWQAIHFTSPAQCEAELVERGLL
jgi:putative hydrolase of the HAD superfamily